jgi:hypothetical protein
MTKESLDVKLTCTGDAIGAFGRTKAICKALGYESITLNFQEGFSMSVNVNSYIPDLYDIYRNILKEHEAKKLKR